MKIQEILNISKKMLVKNNIEDAPLIARILLANILKVSKEKLVIDYDKEISKQAEDKFLSGIEKISNGYPLEYITNHKEFMKMDFFVNESVLIPRADTEILVEEVIKLCKKNDKKNVLELCTGSGIIAISLAKNVNDIKITATDISKDALDIARKNEKSLLNENKIQFIQSDMFEKINKKYDLIVANPPYIKTDIIKEYALKYEPKLALDGGLDGLNFYRTIIEEGCNFLNENGIIAIEIGYDQKEEIIEMANNSKKFNKIDAIKDLGNNDRVIILHK